MWIPKDKFCDGIDDCFDNSDETDCGDDCNIMAEMQCGNTSECIIHNWKCDGHDDCSDGWDESSSTCGTNIILTTIIMYFATLLQYVIK